jgi:hypothetical protein
MSGCSVTAVSAEINEWNYVLQSPFDSSCVFVIESAILGHKIFFLCKKRDRMTSKMELKESLRTRWRWRKCLPFSFSFILLYSSFESLIVLPFCLLFWNITCQDEWVGVKVSVHMYFNPQMSRKWKTSIHSWSHKEEEQETMRRSLCNPRGKSIQTKQSKEADLNFYSCFLVVISL